MRFREFNRKQNVSELVPAIGQGLRAVGGAAIKATQSAVGMATKNISKALAPTGTTPTSPDAEKSKVPSIPAIGSEIVLPDKDTKRPASYTIKGIKGGEVELQPVLGANKSGDPKVSVKVRMQDLQNTMKALSPDAQQQGQIKNED